MLTGALICLGLALLTGIIVIVGLRASRTPLGRLRQGDYGNAAMYRQWRLEDEQKEDNRNGMFARVNFRR